MNPDGLEVPKDVGKNPVDRQESVREKKLDSMSKTCLKPFCSYSRKARSAPSSDALATNSHGLRPSQSRCEAILRSGLVCFGCQLHGREMFFQHLKARTPKKSGTFLIDLVPILNSF